MTELKQSQSRGNQTSFRVKLDSQNHLMVISVLCSETWKCDKDAAT